MPDESRAPQGPPPAYQKWRVTDKLYDENMNLIDEFEDTQETVIIPPNITVRRTRTLPDGEQVVYEDKGTVNQSFQISGKTGYGGDWHGQLFMDGWVYTYGTGGKAEFQMVNTRLHNRNDGNEAGCCLRIVDVKEPVQVLTAEPLEPGRYFLTTEEYVISHSDEVPASMK